MNSIEQYVLNDTAINLDATRKEIEVLDRELRNETDRVITPLHDKITELRQNTIYANYAGNGNANSYDLDISRIETELIKVDLEVLAPIRDKIEELVNKENAYSSKLISEIGEWAYYGSKISTPDESNKFLGRNGITRCTTMNPQTGDLIHTYMLCNAHGTNSVPEVVKNFPANLSMGSFQFKNYVDYSVMGGNHLPTIEYSSSTWYLKDAVTDNVLLTTLDYQDVLNFLFVEKTN